MGCDSPERRENLTVGWATCNGGDRKRFYRLPLEPSTSRARGQRRIKAEHRFVSVNGGDGSRERARGVGGNRRKAALTWRMICLSYTG